MGRELDEEKDGKGELEGVEVKARGGVRWPESYVATSRQPLSTE